MDQHPDISATDPRLAADELLVHGMLTHMHADSAGAQQARVERVITQIAALQERAGSAGPIPIARGVRSRRATAVWKRVALGVAAALAITGGLVILGLPAEPTALAQTQRALSQLRSAGERRYEVRAIDTDRRAGAPADAATETSPPIGIVDMRAPSTMLIRAILPDGRPIVVGRDAKGPWNLRPNGHIDRTDYQRGWPRWAEVDGQPLLADSVDQLLESVTRGYTLERRPADATAADGTPLDRIIARRAVAQNSEPGASEPVPQTGRGDKPPLPQPGLRGGPDGPGGPAAQDDDAGPPALVHDDLLDDGGPGPDGPGFDRPGPDGPGPDGPGPDGPGGPGRPGGPQPSQIDILIHRASNTVERIELRWPEGPRGPRGPEGGPRGGEGRRPPPGLPPRDRAGPRDRPPPRDLGPMRGPPGFPPMRPRGDRPGPPRLLIIQRVNTPTLDDAWFDPLTHLPTFER